MCLLLADPFFCLPSLTLYAQGSNNSTQIFTLAIRDQQGRFVTDIQANQIVISGQGVSVQRLELDNAPRRIVLLLDTSGSMGDYRSFSWSNVAHVAIQIALQRKGNDLIGLETFAEKEQILVPLTMDSQLLVKHIEALTSSGRGRTMMGLALREILSRRENGLRFGDAMILVSDGDRSLEDKTDFAQLGDDLIRAGVRICLIRVQPMMGFGATSGVSDASDFVADVGGIKLNMYSPLEEVHPGDAAQVDPKMIESTAQAAYDFVRTYYRVGVEISEPLQRPRQLRLRLVDQQRSMKRLQLNYPRYLLPVQ